MGVKKRLLTCSLVLLLLFGGALQCTAAPSKTPAEGTHEISTAGMGIKDSAIIGKSSNKKAGDSKKSKTINSAAKKTNKKLKSEDKSKANNVISSVIDTVRANIFYIALAIALIVVLIMVLCTVARKPKKTVKTIRYYNNSKEPEKGGISIGNAQHIGRREDQQDSFAISDIHDSALVKEKGIFAIVADGMGGLSNGKESSNIVVSTMLDAFSARMNSRPLPEELRESVILANQRVSKASDLRDRQRSGSTVVAVVIKENRLYWISVGDSRIYIYRNGSAYQINRDHVYGLELYDKAISGTISMEEAKTNPERKSLTSYIGSPSVEEIDQNIKPFQLLPGDRIILCSDGIYGSVTEPEFNECLSLEPYQAAQELVSKITGKEFPQQDNMTVIVIGYD